MQTAHRTLKTGYNVAKNSAIKRLNNLLAVGNKISENVWPVLLCPANVTVESTNDSHNFSAENNHETPAKSSELPSLKRKIKCSKIKAYKRGSPSTTHFSVLISAFLPHK